MSHYVPLRRHLASLIPGDVFDLDLAQLDKVWFHPPVLSGNDSSLVFSSGLLFEEALVLNVPFIGSIGLAIGGAGLNTPVPLSATLLPNFAATVGPVSVAVIVNSDLLRPARRVSDGNGAHHFEVIPDEVLIIQLGSVVFTFDLDGNFSFALGAGFSLPPAMVGTSGVVIEADNVIIRMSGEQELPASAIALGLDDDWRGLYVGIAQVSLPDELSQLVPDDLTVSDCYIGNDGFTGSIDADWDPAFSANLFGIQLQIQHIGVQIVQSDLDVDDLSGSLSLPALLRDDDFPAPISFSVEEGAAGYRILAKDIPPLRLGGVDVEFVTLSIGFNATEVTDAGGSGVLRIIGLEKTDGSQAEIDFTVGYDSGFYKLNTSLPSVKLGPFVLVLDTINVSFNNTGSVSANIIGSLTFPCLEDTDSIGFGLDVAGDAYAFKATYLPPLKLGDLGIQFTTFELSFGRNIPLDTEIAGKITIPGVKDTQGEIATLDFEWNTAGGQHTLITSNLPTLAVGGFELMLSDCDIAVSDAGLESFNAEGTFLIPGLENPPGTPEQIGFALGLQDGIFRVAVSSVPTLHLGPLELSIDPVDLILSEAGVHSAELSGRLTVPGLETDGDATKIQFGLKADGDVFSISAGDLDELPPLKLGELLISLNSFEVTFGENVFSSSIKGFIEVPFFENSAGETLRLDVTIDLDDGFGVTATVPGGEVTILDIADVIRVALFKLSFGYGTNGVRFAIGGRIENRLSVPMLDALVPSKIIVNNLSYDPQTDDMDLDLEVAWPSGLSIAQDGANGFEVVVPVGEIGGGLSLDAVKLIFADKGAAYDISIAFQGAVLSLGPLTGTVSGLGFVATVEPRSEGDGNLGPLQLDLGYLPVTGLGFSVNTCGLGGGGCLRFDDINKRYAGVLALDFGDIGLVAIGLITTRMPDGTDGFSMLVSITATFDPPIELSYGFTLSGVGGLIAVNRSMSTEELRKGIKTGAIDSIMFPEPSTVIANAAKIISDMRSVFPVAEGQYVIGPMLKLGWGSPVNIVVVDLGIFIEIGISGSGFEVARVVLMGQAEMALPTPEQKTIEVKIDILGVLDLERKEASFQAAIEASSLMAFKMYGDCAFLVSWGGRPDMALAIGGFHPKFTPPPPPSIFADLRRMSLVVNYGPLIELGCTGYLAVTPNSLQFGAQVHLFVGISELDVGIRGYLGFDALFIFSPFSFEFSVCAGMTITAMDITLTEISVQFTLSGPKPWNAYGKAVFKILFWDVDANFNITWGESRPATRPLIDPWPDLKDALVAPGAWGTSLPPHCSLVESLASLEGEGADSTLVVHPVSMLELRQNVLPLNINLEKFGNASITGHDRFEIVAVTSGGSNNLWRGEFLKEYFARGQFENLDGDKKLSIPSFEKMDAGIPMSSSNAVQLGTGDTVDFEESVADYDSSSLLKDGNSEPAPKRGSSDWVAARVLTEEYARTRAHRRRGTGNRFLDAIRGRFTAARGPSSFQPLTPSTGNGRSPSPAAVNVTQDGYRVVNASDLTTATLDPSIGSINRGLTKVGADQSRLAQLALDSSRDLIVVAEYEITDYEDIT